MMVNELGIRRVTTPDGTAYELVSFETAQILDHVGVHRITTSAFDRENQFLFEVVAPPCTQNEILTTRAQTEQQAEDHLRGHTWIPGDSDRMGPAAS
jgi:hypothetical protein